MTPKETLTKVVIGGAMLLGLGTAPIVPSEMELLYSFQCPCLEETPQSNATSSPDTVSEMYVSEGDEAVSVFADKKGNKVFVPISKEKYKRMGEVAGIAENPTKNEYISVFEAFVEPEEAKAAIAYDSGVYAANANASSLTFAFNNVAGDVIYVFGYDRSGGATLATGVTYAAAALTKIVELDGAGGGVRNDRAITSWRRASPATGSNNVVVTLSASSILRYSAASYSGENASATIITDTSVGDSVTSLSTDLTTTVDGCWMAHFSKDGSGNRTYTNTTGDTIRLNTDPGGSLYTDTGAAISPAGANTITHTMTTVDLGGIAWTVCPSAVSNVAPPQPPLMFQ